MSKTERRREQLMPGGIPRWIRVWDNGGGFKRFCRKCLEFSDDEVCAEAQCGRKTVEAGFDGSIDRYTVVYTGNYQGRGGRCDYVGMSSHPSHPQGFGQHGEHADIIDVPRGGFPATIGDKGRLGRRITFQALPRDCQELVMNDYLELWRLDTNHRKGDV